MSKAPQSPQPRSGIAGVLLVFCVAALLAGLGFDVGLGARAHFWIGDQPAAATAIGIVAALFAIVASIVGRLLLGRKREES